MKKLLTIIFLILITYAGAFSQNKVMLQVFTDEESLIDLKFLHRWNKGFDSDSAAYFFLKSKISKLRNRNYLEANIDSLKQRNDSLIAFIHLGNKYSLSTRTINNDNSGNLSFQVDKISNWKALQKIQTSIIYNLNRSGYPFARIATDSVGISNNKITNKWNVEKGNYIVWDDLKLKGSLKINQSFLQKYLDIRAGRGYDEKNFTEISSRIKNLEFVRENKPAEIEFSNKKAKVYNYLDKAPANRLDGILGFQSNPDKHEKLTLTGEINLYLSNAFKSGEQISLNWQKYDSQSQNLALGFTYPFVFSKTGLDFDYSLLKQDSSYLTNSVQLGVRIFQKGNRHVKLYYNYQSSTLLSSQQLVTSNVLPDFADVKTNLWGIGLNFQNLDYPFNPHKGFRISINLGVGNHIISKNKKLPDYLYDDVKLNSTLLNSVWMGEVYLPLSNKISFRIKNIGGILKTGSSFSNDLFRLGGLSNLRGFDENSFLASKYTVLTSELRFIPEQNTSFYLFCDAAYYKSELVNSKLDDFPIGLGLGFNFATQSGVFSLSYAIGKQENQSFGLRNAKIHFGFVSRF